jgi:hypothetical protein
LHAVENRHHCLASTPMHDRGTMALLALHYRQLVRFRSEIDPDQRRHGKGGLMG